MFPPGLSCTDKYDRMKQVEEEKKKEKVNFKIVNIESDRVEIVVYFSINGKVIREFPTIIMRKGESFQPG